jgi:hypothetical protein
MEVCVKSRKLSAGLIAAALAAGYFAGRAVEIRAQARRVLEIRTYVTPDKTGLDNLVTRMRSEGAIFDRLGMKSVMFSVAAEPPASENTFIYILAHESREKAKENWSAFGKDAEWQQLRKTAAPTGQIKITSTFVTPTDFSPLQ